MEPTALDITEASRYAILNSRTHGEYAAAMAAAYDLLAIVTECYGYEDYSGGLREVSRQWKTRCGGK